MSENFSPGDLVCVVRSSCTCSATQNIGAIFTLNLSDVSPAAVICSVCRERCAGAGTRIWVAPEMEKFFPIPVGYIERQLRKIPPLSELEADTASNIIPAYYREKIPA